MKHKYLTLFIVGFDRASAKRINIHESLIKYFYHYLAGIVVFLLSVFTLSIIIFSNYHDVKSENSMLLGKIETMQKETEAIETYKLKEKLNTIDRSLSDINDYLLERGVKDNSRSTANLIPFGDYNVDIIDYYCNYVGDVYNTLRSVPLGYPYYGELSSGYGYRTNPFGGASGEFHPGIDFKGERGDEITACADGYVKSADWYGGYGNAVVIEHGFGLSTLYGHMSRTNVQAGQFVKAGDVIGYMGSTGRSTGNHVHYEIRKDGSDISPSEFLSLN
jgi:murein DD-endopeptidase MepM/ murein hydrolase activator NlpD